MPAFCDLLLILGVMVGAICLYAGATDRRNVRKANTPPLLGRRYTDETSQRDLMDEVKRGEQP